MLKWNTTGNKKTNEKIYYRAKELCSRADPYANKSLPLEFVVGVSGEKSTQVYIDCEV